MGLANGVLAILFLICLLTEQLITWKYKTPLIEIKIVPLDLLHSITILKIPSGL